MKIQVQFNIEYFTKFGECIYVCGSAGELGNNNTDKAVRMEYVPNGQWKLTVDLNEKTEKVLTYKYFLKSENSHTISWEWGEPRIIDYDQIRRGNVYIRDFWRPSKNHENVFFSSAFTENLMARKRKNSGKANKEYYNHRFQLYAPRINKDLFFCICGADRGLGEWNAEKAQVMDDTEYPLWKVDIMIESDVRPIEYKYGIYDKTEKKLISWEYGPNRIIDHEKSVLDNILSIHTDQSYRYPHGLWKGAGIAIPVFSIRTQNSWGAGEFNDVKQLVDWADKTGLRVIQILPINDTIASHTWMDSYPYAAISVYALHPMYLHCPDIGILESGEEMEEFSENANKLNQLPEIDYLGMMKLKSIYYKRIYDQQRDEFLQDPEFKSFFRDNKEWLVPYAAFSCLRDRFATSDFTRWGEYSEYDKKEIDKLTHPGGRDYDDIAVHYFIQFHLHKQMLALAAYARKKGVVLKGDIPIGIFRNSVDAWISPDLYHMDKQAGAPPDAYSITGQNWKFPTYNWEQMAKDNYAWWRSRLTYMSKYFDAYRIDHILGFFRIWEIPLESVEGLMGKFYPSIPLHRHELEARGLNFDYDRFCKPYIREYMLDMILGELKNEVIEKHLEKTGSDRYMTKPGSSTQKQIEELYETLEDDSEKDIEKKEQIKFGMYQLIGNILFLEDPGSNGTAFHPKIAFHQTLSYKEFDDYYRHILNEIYTDYFYHRQENYWREQAMIKLPAITGASNMLVCGEDLGMVPDCVPGVMEELNILRLYIQRMPKVNWSEFGHPADAPYLSVSSPSCHDMSTIRGWWEDDHNRSQRFYNQIMGREGAAPAKCEVWISEEIINQHFYSPSMWSIFPLQDLLGLDDQLRRANTKEEQINDPSNPKNPWKYRMHLFLEDLLNNPNFTRKLLEKVMLSGRMNKI
jgi:4-alpha-glucanotransferase